jgi:RNA recognition motif-containing protein
MLGDVFIADKLNLYGKVFGFVRFKNFKDPTKMVQAIHNVWFGNFKTYASDATFGKENIKA